MSQDHDSITLCVFAKPPEAGKTKTRLARSIGDDAAAMLARAFLRDSLEQLERYSSTRQVLATTEAWPKEIPIPRSVEIWQQGPGDLGARLERIMLRALQDTKTVVALGADTPGLPQKHMLETVAHLQSCDSVLGPTQDGGFYALGLRRCPPGVLEGIPWSTPDTFQRTLEQLRAFHLAPMVVSPWFDIDEFDDLIRLQSYLDRGLIEAPYSAAAIESLGPFASVSE